MVGEALALLPAMEAGLRTAEKGEQVEKQKAEKSEQRSQKTAASTLRAALRSHQAQPSAQASELILADLVLPVRCNYPAVRVGLRVCVRRRSS